MPCTQIVWFKRDLRVHDHWPLTLAAQQGPVLPLFVWEASVWEGGEYTSMHQGFVQESLDSLRWQLAEIGLQLHLASGDICHCLTIIKTTFGDIQLWSHEETGNDKTFLVDKRVAAWCREHQVVWQEMAQHGVVRRLKQRDHWQTHWEKRMAQQQAPIPQASPATSIQAMLPNPILHISGTDLPKRQRGGLTSARRWKESFLQDRARFYRGGISSPNTAMNHCSRLSPFLAWGIISMREIVQATRVQIYAHPQTGLGQGLRAFESRLYWHCHFIQKLESEPAIEYQNMHHAYDGLRDITLESMPSRLQRWQAGETGWPLVDASMRMLRQTGWLNFRMRAMLMSTASYLLWLDWRAPGLHLAQCFLDYEPGIHWPQVQMQAGTTGINALRMYNPILQAQKLDPQGKFVRQWIPALRNVPDAWIFEPWHMPAHLQAHYGCHLDRDYPIPMVEIGEAIRNARAQLYQVRRSEQAHKEAQTIRIKHASRKGMRGSERDETGQLRSRKRPKQTPSQESILQGQLFD